LEVPGALSWGDGRRMRPRKKVRSRRCTECKRWFPPKASAAETQQTCSETCHLARRNRQSKARRAANLKRFQAAERERQARSRANRRQLAQSTGPPGDKKLPAELQRLVEGVLELAHRRPSHAALAAALTRLAYACAAQAQAGP